MRLRTVEGLYDGLYLKAMIGRFDEEDWDRPAIATMLTVPRAGSISLLRQEGWDRGHFLIMDLSGGCGGALFRFGGNARVDIEKAPAVF